MPWGVRVPGRACRGSAGPPPVHACALMGLRAGGLQAGARRSTGSTLRARPGRTTSRPCWPSTPTAFGSDPDEYRPWTEPHLDAPGGHRRARRSWTASRSAPPTRCAATAPPGRLRSSPASAVARAARRRGIGGRDERAGCSRAAFADGARLAHLHPDTDAAARVYARLGFSRRRGARHLRRSLISEHARNPQKVRASSRARSR